MIRFSLIIQNHKNEYLICERPSSDKEIGNYEFLGGELDLTTLPDFKWFTQQIKIIIYDRIGVKIGEMQKIEMYWRDEPLWAHTIFAAKIVSGNPQKNFYTKLKWLPISKIPIESSNYYGLQVFRKLDECTYCHFIRNRQDELDRFFENFFTRQEENLSVLQTLEDADTGSAQYILVFKQEMIHLRASLIENTKLKKNITVQNYFMLYGRPDLAEKINTLLCAEVRSGLSLKELVKESVDKYIAHYDEPSSENKNIYNYCLSIFSATGKLPLNRFIPLLDGYIIALITEMWYDAGELGISMSNRCPEDRKVIIEYGNNCYNQIISALSGDITH